MPKKGKGYLSEITGLNRLGWDLIYFEVSQDKRGKSTPIILRQGLFIENTRNMQMGQFGLKLGL
jgi:hypothetical protein